MSAKINVINQLKLGNYAILYFSLQFLNLGAIDLSWLYQKQQTDFEMFILDTIYTKVSLYLFL